MERSQALNLLVRHARSRILQDFRVDSCIASSRIALDVLECLDIQARALVVEVCVMNPPMAKRVQSGQMPPDRATSLIWEREDGSWSVGVGLKAHGNLTPNGWPGHLVVVGSDFMIDLSIDQASRPERDILLNPFWVPWTKDISLARFCSGASCPLSVENGSVLIYSARPRDVSFQESPDWTQLDRRLGIVTDLLRLMKRAEI